MQYFLKYFGEVRVEQEQQEQQPQMETQMIGEPVKGKNQLKFKLKYDEPKGGEA